MEYLVQDTDIGVQQPNGVPMPDIDSNDTIASKATLLVVDEVEPNVTVRRNLPTHKYIYIKMGKTYCLLFLEAFPKAKIKESLEADNHPTLVEFEDSFGIGNVSSSTAWKWM